MPTPQELARAAEHFDEEQWFDFLDELDIVSRRRQEKDARIPAPAGREGDEMALWIARKHLTADSGIREVLYGPKKEYARSCATSGCM